MKDKFFKDRLFYAAGFSVILLCLLFIVFLLTTTHRQTISKLPLPFLSSSPRTVLSSPDPHNNPFGLLLSSGASSAKAMLALNVSYYRPPQSIAMSTWNGNCADCDWALQNKKKIFPTISNSSTLPSTPISDPASFQKNLGAFLDKYHPEIIAIENEEDSPANFSGSPKDYSAEIKLACSVAHARHVLCTNGGFSSETIGLLEFSSLLSPSTQGDACKFALQTFPPLESNILCNTTSVQQLTSSQIQAIVKGQQLLALYKQSSLDLFNFHWYFTDANSLKQTSEFSKIASGLPLVSNEVGQKFLVPYAVEPLMQVFLNEHFRYSIWNAQDTNSSFGMIETDGSLRANGSEFRTITNSRFSSS
jgi:hypothetical protein